jgi:ribosomal protein S18 acetylase RimI-like enzyme
MKLLDVNKCYFQFQDYPEKIVVDYLEQIITDKTADILIARTHETVVGFIGGKIQENFLPILSPVKIGYIFGAYVLSDYRKKGIMKALEKQIISFFKKKDISYIDLNVMSYNKSGLDCWEQLGYKVFREQRRKII